MTGSQFAEDAAIYVKTRDTFEQPNRMVVEQHVAYGDMSSLPLERGSIEAVDEFTYLGSNTLQVMAR